MFIFHFHFQMLITEPGNDQKDKSKEINKSTSKGSKVQDSPESHVELDSRLLSAVLTVSLLKEWIFSPKPSLRL